jgi:ABC-type uncharacterized transport system auxiliary subunit
MQRTYLIFSAILLLAIGCRSQKNPAIKYYTLEFQSEIPDSVFLAPPMTNYSCEITKVEVNQAFASHRIANREASNAIVFYSWHQWAVRPGEILTTLNESYFMQEGIFGKVAIRSLQMQPDYRLHTSVHRLETVNNEKSLNAHLRMQLILEEIASSKIVVSLFADEQKPLVNNNINEFAAVISDIYQDQLKEMADRITLYFDNNQ